MRAAGSTSTPHLGDGGQVGSFADTRPFDGDAKDITLALGASNGVLVHGKVGPGKPAPNGYVQIGLASTHDADLFAVPIAADGTFEASLPRGEQYDAQIFEGGMGSGSGKRTGDRATIAIRLTVLAPPPQVAVDWIGAHAILDHQPAGTRMVVWAHNAHIANRLGDASGAPVNMGALLRKQLKTGYVSLSFVFSQGSFQAETTSGPRRGVNEVTLGDPPEANASVAFARTGKPLLVLDLRALPRRGVVHDWFTAPHPVRDTGVVFSSEKDMTSAQILPERYDAVIFVERRTRARPSHLPY